MASNIESLFQYSFYDIVAVLICYDYSCLANTIWFIRSYSHVYVIAQEANELYEYFCEKLIENGVKNVYKGVFGADMKVDLLNDGPVTILYDSEIWRKK